MFSLFISFAKLLLAERSHGPADLMTAEVATADAAADAAAALRTDNITDVLLLSSLMASNPLPLSCGLDVELTLERIVFYYGPTFALTASLQGCSI